MLKSAAQSAALFVFLLVALFLGFLLVRTLFPHAQSIEQGKTEQPQQYNAEKDENRKPAESFWQRPTDDPVAFFTLWIAAFTALLVLVSAFQIGFLIRADDTAATSAQAAKKAADAAQQSADAIANVERPYIFIIAKPSKIVAKDGPAELNPTISYSYANLGRVPAVIRLVYAQCFLAQQLSPNPTYSRSKFQIAQNPIGAGLASTDPLVCELKAPLTTIDWADIIADKQAIIFTAIFLYEGALDYTYVTAVTYKIGQSIPNRWHCL
jgi:hypothetical protein